MATVRILLVEDDEALGGQIADKLGEAGFEAIWWKEGRALSKDQLPEGVALVVLDLMLPGTYGMDMLKQLRAWSGVPVLMLSARNDTVDKVRALSLGADDYLTKPFWPEELIERVRARLRRPLLARPSAVDVGHLRIDRDARAVTIGGVRVDLTRVEFDFVAALADRPGTAITRRWLAENVLDADRDGGERTLDVHASRIRKKLGPGVLETVWGIGYRLGGKPRE